MFSVRLVTADSYQAQPLPQLDPTFSEFRGCEIKNVPVIRVFGTTPTGEKTCLHVHGVFPYLYVPYTAEESEERLAYRLAASLDTAINISLGSAASTNQHVYQIQRVAGIPFYGYHRREHQFFKISFYNPAIMKKAADLLQSGAVLGQSFQPHEAHLNYTLQFMIDYNLYGMSFINLSNIKYRRGNSSSSGGEILSPYDNVISPADNNTEYLPASVLRQSICELEIDAIASDILNREDLARGIELNPGLSAIWSEERERRRQAGLVGGDSQLVNPRSPPRPPFRPTDSDLYQEQRLARRLLMISQCDESTLSMSTNSTPYPAEVSPGDVILNASNFGSSSTQTSDKTQRANETLSLSSLGSTQSTQTSHECSVLDSDDLPLLELLENLARDSDTRDSVDEDSVLGTQRSGFDEAEEDKSDNDDNEVNEDLNLTCLELESWSSWESAKRTAATTSFENPQKSPVSDEDMDTTLLGALLAAGMDSDNSESQESAVPQLDGAGDLCSSLLDSEEEENMQMQEVVQEGNEQLTQAYLQSQQVMLNEPSNPQSIPSNSSLSPSTSSTCSDGTTGSWSSVVPSETYLDQYNTIEYENLGEDFVDDIENIMQMEMNFSNSTVETLVSSNLAEDETIPIERVLNGDPCFTQTAELDKSDLTELQNQYVSLLDSELLTGIYENSQNLDLINNTVSEDTRNSGVVGQTEGIVAENVIQCVQQEADVKSSVSRQISAPVDEADVDNQNCDEANRLTSDSSDYNCNVVTWEELQDLQYLPKRTVKRKCTRKLNQNVERKMCKVAKSEVGTSAVANNAESNVAAVATDCEEPEPYIDNERLAVIHYYQSKAIPLTDIRPTLPGVQYLPYSLGENENLVTPILADFEELIDPRSPSINPPRFVSHYCSKRAHSGIIFGSNWHRHGSYSFKHNKFVQKYPFFSNEIWIIEKRKRGKVRVCGSKICRDKYCRLPYVPLEKVNVEVVPSELGENCVEAAGEVAAGVAEEKEEENREDSNSINSGEDSASINDSTVSPGEEDATCKDPNYVPPEEISAEGAPEEVRKKKNEKNTFTRITRQSERNFIQSQTSTESGDGPVIIRRVFEEKTNGSSRVKRRKIILKVGSNTDSQSDDSRIEEKPKVPVKMKRRFRLAKRKILKIGGEEEDSSPSYQEKNPPIFPSNVACTNNKEKLLQNRPRILCSIKTKKIGWKWLLSITNNQNTQSSLSTSALKIRKIETLSQKYKVHCRKKENANAAADVPQGKSITTLEQNGKVEEETIPLAVIMPEVEEQQLDNLPELCGSIYRNDVGLMSEELSSEPLQPLDKTPLPNDDTVAAEMYTTTVSDVNLYSGKDYTIDAVSQEIPQCLFEEDSNTSLNNNENTINMMSLKRSVDEIEAHSTLDQSENLSIKSFDGEAYEEEEEQYSDHESGILSMADDSGSNSTVNNEALGDTSPNSFRALLINELQKRCQRCERCDCNSYMTRLAQSTDGRSTGSLRSEKIFLHEEKMNLVTKSIFRLIGESSEVNSNVSRVAEALMPGSNIDSEDDTLKDVSDKYLDSDIKSGEISLNSTPKSSPKKISILRKIYSPNVESSHSDEASDCEKNDENRSKVQVNSLNDSVNCVDHLPSEKPGDSSERITSGVYNSLESNSNLPVIDDRKRSSKGDIIEDTTVSNNAQSSDSSDREYSEPLETPDAYLQVVLQEDNKTELIIGADQESNSEKTLASSENEMTSLNLNATTSSGTFVSNPLAIEQYRRKSYSEVVEQEVINKIPCVNDEVSSASEKSGIVINPLYKFRKITIATQDINESSVPAVRSELIDINEDTRDTFIIDSYFQETAIDNFDQHNSTETEDLSMPDTVILETSADAAIDNKSSSNSLNIQNSEERAFNSINKELSPVKSVTTDIREPSLGDNTTPINLESRDEVEEENEKEEESQKCDRIEVTQAVEQNENQEKQDINHSPFKLPEILSTFIDHARELETSKTPSETGKLSSSNANAFQANTTTSTTVEVTSSTSQEISPLVSSQDDTLSIQLSSTSEKFHGTSSPDSRETSYDISFDDEIEFLSSPEPCEDETINVIINNLNDDEDDEEEAETIKLIEKLDKPKFDEPQVLSSESTSASVELIIPPAKLPEEVTLIKPLETHPKTLPNEFSQTTVDAADAAAAAAAVTAPLADDLQTTKVPEGPSPIKCRGLSIKLERLSPNLVTKYLKPTNPLELNERKEEVKVHRVKKNVSFSPDVLIFQTNEQVPLSDSAEVKDEECSETCKSKSETKSTSLKEEMRKVSNEANSEKSSKRLREKVCESTEDKVADKFEENQTTKSNSSSNNNNNNHNNNNDSDKSKDTNNGDNSEESPKNSKRVKTSDNGISIEPDDTDITQQGQEVSEILNDCTTVVEHEEKLEETCMERVLHESLFEKEKEKPKADIKIPEISTSESHESHPQHSVELRDKNPPKKSDVELPEFQVVQNFPKLEFSRRSKIPTKRCRSPVSSTSPVAAMILSPENSMLNELQPIQANRYFKNYTLQSPCRIKNHTLSVDKRLVISKMSVRHAKVEGKSEKENFLFQLGLYPMNPQLFTWGEEISYIGYIQRQEPKIAVGRLTASTLKRYGYTHRFKSNRLGKRFLNGHNFSYDSQIPAFDGPADLTSSESEASDDEEIDISIEHKEKRVCRYNLGKAREAIVTPKKRKHSDSPEDEPQAAVATAAVKSLCVTPKRAHLHSPKPSTLKSPRGLSGNYTPLKIIITSPKVRTENPEPHEQSSRAVATAAAVNNPTACLTPKRRKEQGLHENLLRGRISIASPSRCSGNSRSQEVDYVESDSRAGTSRDIIRSSSASEDEMRQERLSDIDSEDASTSIGMNVRKNLFTTVEEKMKKSPTIILSPKASTSRGVKNSEDNNNSDENPKEAESSGSEKTLLFDEENDFHLKYSTLENTFLMDDREEKERRENIVVEENEIKDEENLCNMTFSQYIGSQLSKNIGCSLDKNQTQTPGDSNRAVKIIPRFNPPTADRIKDTMESYGISKCRNPQPYFSKQADAPGQKELAHKMLKVPGKSLADVAIFKSATETITGINRWRRMKINEFHPSKGKIQASSIRQSLAGHGSIIITPLLPPPSLKSVKTWIKAREYLKKKKEKDQDEEEAKNQKEKDVETKEMDKNEKNNENTEAGENSKDSSDSSIVEPSPEKIVHSNSLRILGRTPKIPQTNKALLFMPSTSSNTQSTNTSDKSIELDRNTPPHSSTSSEKSMNPSLMSMLEKSKLFKGTQHSKHHGISCGQIEGISESSTRSDIANENMQNAKAITTYQYITLMSVEVHVITRGDLLPDPEHDSVSAIFYAIQRDIPPSTEKKVLEHGVIAVAPEGSKKLGYSYGSNLPFSITLVPSESALFESFITLVIKTDPEIFIGWELESLSWGYIFQRATTFGVNLNKRISRIPGIQCKWEATAAPDLDALGEIKLPGRVVLDIWRLMRHEMALLNYSFENVMYHVMNERIPCPSFKILTNWWNSSCNLKNRWKVVEHYGVRVLGVLRILEQLDIIGRTSEHARLFGIQFYEVFTRGSQFRVESIMLRLAKPLNYIAVSPSMQQRASMRAMEALPLIMEPESVFYSDPVIVLDFQSLYPSIIIAHNYCFSTCLGRIEHIGQPYPFKFGAGVLKITKSTALKLQGNVNFSPCGIAFVKEQVRQGILPRMLTEILETRFMVKKAMKDHDKNDKTLQRVLHSRQLGLKFLANVTYGYTAANFTGRMPCVEVGDSVVAKAKETLERAIKLVEDTPKWGARVVYGDTDSLFILAPGKSKEDAFKIGYEIADAVTADNPKPIKLKFEKVLFPTILQTKKRYCGYMWESPEQEKPTYLAKGIETVRRDGCPAVSKILEKTLKILFDTKDVSQVKQYVVRQMDKILQGKVSIQDLTFAKEFRGLRGYKEKACVPALELTRRLMKKDPRALPRHGERVKYVIVAGAPNQALIHCVRSPWEVLNDPGLRPNAVYYVTRVIIPPLNRCLNLMGVDVNTWYKEMPHRHILDNPVALPSDKQKQTIFQYFGNIVCAACGQTSNKALCNECQSRPTDTLVMLHEKLRWLERINEQVRSICQSCVGRSDTADCSSLDCPVLYRRAQAQREFTQGVQLEGIIKEQTIDF